MAVTDDNVMRLNLEAYESHVRQCRGDGIYPHDAEMPTRCPTCGRSAMQALLIREIQSQRASLRAFRADLVEARRLLISGATGADDGETADDYTSRSEQAEKDLALFDARFPYLKPED